VFFEKGVAMVIYVVSQAVQESFRRRYRGHILLEVVGLGWRRILRFKALHPFDAHKYSYAIYRGKRFFMEISQNGIKNSVFKMTPARWFLMDHLYDAISSAVSAVNTEYVSDAYRRLGYGGTLAFLEKLGDREFKGKFVFVQNIDVRSATDTDCANLLKSVDEDD
jgi:hypothetical protein